MGTSEMWFGLMPERGIIYATFIVRQLQEKKSWKKEKPLLRHYRFGKSIR